MLRPRFSLLSLLLLSLVCAAGMGVYWRSAAWVVEREIPRTADNDIFSAQISPNGQYIVVHVEADQIECYSTDGQKLWGPVPAELLNVSFSFDSRKLFIGNSKTIRILDLKTGNLDQRIKTDSFENAVLASNGKFLFQNAYGFTGWNMMSGRTVFELSLAPSLCFPTYEFDQNRKRIHSAAIQDLPKAKNLISYSEILRGPAESNYFNDIELESLAELNWDDPEIQGSVRPFSYPYATNSVGYFSKDGSRIVTAVAADPEFVGRRTSLTLWSSNTLERLGDFRIPDDYYFHSLSPRGEYALLIHREKCECCVVSVPQAQVLFRTETRRGWSHIEEYSGFTEDGLHIYESMEISRGNAKSPEYFCRIYRVRDGRLVNTMPDIMRPKKAFPDMQRVLIDSGTLGEMATSSPLFVFKRHDDETTAVYECYALFPDNEHVLTNGRNHSLLIWKRVRPEWWWGHFWLWETHALIVFSLAFFWSLLYRPRPRAKASTSAASVITAA